MGRADKLRADMPRVAVSTVAAVRARAVAAPAWVWVAGIVVCSTAVRIALEPRMVAPWIMIDELVYSELAKSFAQHGQFLVRGVPEHGYGFVYPVLIAPAWGLFDRIPDAYSAAKAINSLLMSLSAVPAYLLARRLLSTRLSLLVAGLTVLVPSMLYTGMLMTENAFYPLFLVVALLLMTTLERPTPRRQLALLVLCGIAFEARAQAIALVPAIATAPLLLALTERRGLRQGLRPWLTLYGTLAGAAILALAATTARGESPLSLLGAYRAAASSNYTVGGILHYLLYHVAELDLYLGILPFAALVAIWLAPREGSTAVRAFAAASLALSVWLVVEVAAFASQPFVARIEERNMFYLAPLALIALLGLASDGVVPRGRPVIAAAVLAGVLPVFIPFTRFITTSAVSDTFALLPWWWAQDHWITLQQVRYAALGVSLAAAALFVLLPRRYALVLPALVAAYFLATTFVVENGRHGIHKTTVGSLFAGTHLAHPDWIDRAVGRDASVAVLWTGPLSADYTVWENEFFNRSVGTIYDLDGAPKPDPLPETAATRAPSGVLISSRGPIQARYLLASASVDLAGHVIATDPVGVKLYRVDGPLVVLTHITGLYKNDTWSGRTVTYERVQCEAGRLSVLLGSDPSLFTTDQVVVAREDGTEVGRIRIAPSAQERLTVPLRPTEPGQRCVVRFDVARTVVPDRVHPQGHPVDARPLGAHFLAFVYRP